jgi:hypothetical protein
MLASQPAIAPKRIQVRIPTPPSFQLDVTSASWQDDDARRLDALSPVDPT